MKILPCQKEDIPALMALMGTFLTEQVSLEPSWAPSSQWTDICKDFLQSVLDNQTYFIDLLKDETAIVGFTMYGFRDEPMFQRSRHGYLADLFVAPSHRKQGFGRAMVDYAMGYLKKNNVDFVQLNVLQANEGGVSFWRSVGFQDQMLRMKLELGDPAPETPAE